MAEQVSTQARLRAVFDAAGADLLRAPFDPETIAHYVAMRIACFEGVDEPPLLKAARTYEAHAVAKLHRLHVQIVAAGFEPSPILARYNPLAAPTLPTALSDQS